MIKPAITPRRITGNATTGIISAARSGVRNIRGVTETISNAPDVTKEQKFGINYVGFFGSKKVGKDLKKSMNTIKDSVGSTFGIAKSLKESVTKGAGVFGFVGKLIGGAAMALPIFALLGVPLLKVILGVIAIGGIGGLLSTFGKQIINFVKDKSSGFIQFIREVVGDFFIDRKTSQEFQSIRQQSDARIEEAISSDKGKDRQQVAVEANQNEIKLLEAERDDYKENNKDDKNYRQTINAYNKRIKQLQTGKLDLGGFANAITQSEAPTVSSFGKKSYVDLSAEKKLEAIRALLRKFGERENINTAKLIYEQELKKGNLLGKKLQGNEKLQAEDIVKYLEMFGDDPLGEIDPKKKEQFLRELSSVNSTPQEAKKISSLSNVNNSSGVSQGGNANNVAVLPMGNNSKQSLVRNDTGGLTSGPTMKIHSNFDADNFVAPINMANFNIV